MPEQPTQDQQDRDRNAINEIERKLRNYVPGPVHWSARGESGENDWCIAIGKGAACFTLDDRARAMGDDFIRELAAQILGYPPDSVQDLERRLNEALEAIGEHERQRQYHEAELKRLFYVQAELSRQLAIAKAKEAN